MEHYDATDIVYESRADFNDYLHKNVFSSLLSFKFKTTQEINDFVDKMWEEEKENQKEQGNEIVDEVDLDAKPFWSDDNWDDEYHITRILENHQQYEENDFAEKFNENLKEMKNKGQKITNKKAHFLTNLKAHPLYDLIIFMCMGNLKAIHYEINRYWNGI